MKVKFSKQQRKIIAQDRLFTWLLLLYNGQALLVDIEACISPPNCICE